MPGLAPGIHVFDIYKTEKSWMAGTSGQRSDAIFGGYARP
jgi:hypothetical protein